MDKVWPTSHVTGLCLHSLPSQRLETEMRTATTDYKSCEKALWTTESPLLTYNARGNTRTFMHITQL